MRMQKRQFRIGDLAKQLGVEKFVIRFWEKEFNVSTVRSTGGQRFYSEEDLRQFARIKTLLYDEGFTIAGAKKQLNEPAPTIVGSRVTTLQEPTEHQTITLLREELLALKKQLQELQKLL